MKVTSLVAVMVVGTDSIDDMEVLRHGRDAPAVQRGSGAVDARDVPTRWAGTVDV